MAEIQGTAKKVWPANGNRPATVVVQNGSGEIKLSTFDAALGATVGNVQEGQLVRVEYETQEKNGYTNHYIQSIEPVGTLDQEIVQVMNTGNSFRNPVHPSEQASIRKAVALNAALSWLGHITDKDGNPDYGVSPVLAIAKQIHDEWLKDDA